MRILSIHADRIGYTAKVKTRIAEPADRREDENGAVHGLLLLCREARRSGP